MNARKLPRLVFMTFLVLTVFWTVVSSVNVIDAESNITPTLIVTDRNFLPYIRGLQQGPTATATPPPPTITPWATNTNTPTPTATEEPQLAAPALYYIANGDHDGNYTVAWSAVSGADYYQLQQNFNSTTYEEIYLGPELSFGRSDMPTGTYCYHVRASGGNQWSDWSEEKCTTVAAQPEPEYLCEFEAIYDGPRK